MCINIEENKRGINMKTKNELLELKLIDLKEYAKSIGLTNISKLKKMKN